MSAEHPQHLLKACLKGDRRAQRQLYEQYKGRMFSLCLRYADSRHDAEDWLQEGFLKVFRDLDQFRSDGPFEGWMRKVILHTILENLRRQKRLFPTIATDNLEHLPEEEAPDREGEAALAQQVLAGLRQLPPGFRTVLNLYILEGYTHAEIATELGISVGTSKSQLMRAKAHLKTLLEKRPII
ncbi:MAG: RNA polymerase sigma factor [Saprospiraceae bacterium]